MVHFESFCNSIQQAPLGVSNKDMDLSSQSDFIFNSMIQNKSGKKGNHFLNVVNLKQLIIQLVFIVKLFYDLCWRSLPFCRLAWSDFAILKRVLEFFLFILFFLRNDTHIVKFYQHFQTVWYIIVDFSHKDYSSHYLIQWREKSNLNVD